MYKVTLSMPIYNVAPYVERALLSALNQTFESIEFLLVDDRGTDNSMEIVRRIIKDHPRGKDVRIIEHPHNIGLGATRNTAIDNAQGEYLFFMDSDDEITQDCIEILYNAIIQNSVDFVAASYFSVVNGKNYPIDYNYTYVNKNDVNKVANIYFQSKISVTTWNKLYDIGFLRNNNIYCIPHHLSEDICFTYQLILNSRSCLLLSNRTYLYYQNDYSITDEKNRSYKKQLRMSDEHVETMFFMKEYGLKFVNTHLYPLICNNNMINSLNYSKETYFSSLLTPKIRKDNIAKMLKQQIVIKKMLKCNSLTLINLILYLVIILPYPIPVLMFSFLRKLKP